MALLVLMAMASCRGDDATAVSRPEGFNPEVLLPMTPVKSQGRTELCWLYAMLAAIETDCLAHGDSVNLSVTWLERKYIEEQAAEAFFSDADISMRGTLPLALNIISRYGLMSYDAYNIDGLNTPDSTTAMGSTTALSRKLKHMVTTMARSGKGFGSARNAVAELLDTELGSVADSFSVYGARYAPQQFMRSCMDEGAWQAYTSFTHHPFNTRFAPELRDNRLHDLAMNVAPDSMMSIIDRSLRSGHPVAWEGCMSSLPESKGNIAKHRQQLFERRRMTDDHCMCIIGMGTAADGKRYYILKNSWGRGYADNGLCYISAQQLALRTIIIVAPSA